MRALRMKESESVLEFELVGVAVTAIAVAVDFYYSFEQR